MPDIEDTGLINKAWGICGFCGAIAALYDDIGDATKGAKILGRSKQRTNMLAELKTFLVMLKAENKTALIKDIESFSATFGQYGVTNVDTFIKQVSDIGDVGMGSADTHKAVTAKYTIALSPQAAVAYLKMMCGFTGASYKEATDDSGDKIIVGVERKTGGKYKGLKHWVYKSGGVYFSWGARYDSIAALRKSAPGYTPCYLITPGARPTSAKK